MSENLFNLVDDPRGIIHVGASIGQEIPFYETLDVPILYFEPLAEPFKELSKNIQNLPNFKAENLAVGDFDGEIEIYESSKGGVSSSPLKPTKHYDYFPLRTFESKKCEQVSLDNYFKNGLEKYNILVLDVQGYELNVLKGSVDVLKNIDYVLSEVWYEQLYENGPLKCEIDSFLKNQGFQEIKTEDVDGQHISKTPLFGNTLYGKVK